MAQLPLVYVSHDFFTYLLGLVIAMYFDHGVKGGNGGTCPQISMNVFVPAASLLRSIPKRYTSSPMLGMAILKGNAPGSRREGRKGFGDEP